MRATLKQVADDAGLSIATVSRALRRKNRRYSVNEEKIYAAARKLGYPFIGESDSSDKTTIALVTEIQQGEFYSLLFHGLHAATRDSKSDIVFINVDGAFNNNYDWREDPVNYIIKLSKKYSGICLFLPGLSKESYTAIKKGVGTYPIVSLIPGKNLKVDTVSFDSYSGGYMVAKHFEEIGYTNMGLITGPGNVMDSSFRKNGFIDHINEKSNLKDRRMIKSILKKKKHLVSDKKIVNNFINKYNGFEYAYEKMNNFKNNALKLLKDFPQNDSNNSIKILLDYIIERKN